MNPFLIQVVTQTVLPDRQRKKSSKQDYSNFELAKGFRELRITVIRLLKDVILISLGIGSAAFGWKAFWCLLNLLTVV